MDMQIISLLSLAVMAGIVLLSHINNMYSLRLEHKERMAEIEARKEMAKALSAAPGEAERNELAKQLLEAYEEAGDGLHNDNGSETKTRWS